MPRLENSNRGDAREGLRHLIFWQHTPQPVPVPPLQRSHHHGAAGKVSFPSSSCAPTFPRCLISTVSTPLKRSTSQVTPLPTSLHPAENVLSSSQKHREQRIPLLSASSLLATSRHSFPFGTVTLPTPSSHAAATGTWKRIPSCAPANGKATQGVPLTRAMATLFKLTFVPKHLPNALSSTSKLSHTCQQTDKPQRAQSCCLT